MNYVINFLQSVVQRTIPHRNTLKWEHTRNVKNTVDGGSGPMYIEFLTGAMSSNPCDWRFLIGIASEIWKKKLGAY